MTLQRMCVFDGGEVGVARKIKICKILRTISMI